jgi:hypothetical protein
MGGHSRRKCARSVVRLLLRNCLERRNRLVDHNPAQLIFKEDRFLRRKRRRIVKRCNREINRIRVFAVFEKQMSAATCGKRSNPIRIFNLARFAFCHDQILARHRSPLHIRRTRASPAIDAMTIDQCNWQALQHVSCPAANASTSDLHTIHLPEQMNQDTRKSGKVCSRFRTSFFLAGVRQGFSASVMHSLA